ncbi:uncharacterized protein LOC144352632 [Saccoglossus kowalevskii]
MAAIRMQCSESDTESMLSSDESYEIEEYDDNERCHDFVLECQGQIGPYRFEPARKVRDVGDRVPSQNDRDTEFEHRDRLGFQFLSFVHPNSKHISVCNFQFLDLLKKSCKDTNYSRNPNNS